MKFQKGFGVIEGLLVLVIIGLIGGAGWYVREARNKTAKSLDSASQVDSKAQASTKEETTKVIEDPTKNWIAYSSKEGQFSLKYPPTWVQASNPEACTPGVLLLGATAATVGKCATDSGSQMLVASQSGDLRSNYELKSTYYPDVATQTVTVNGVSGKRQTGTYKSVPGEEVGLGPAEGEKKITYTFYTHDRTYSASYSIRPGYPDVLQDFDTMMTKSLKFSN